MKDKKFYFKFNKGELTTNKDIKEGYIQNSLKRSLMLRGESRLKTTF